ncbi:MAG: hypothetical protein DRR19_08150 [Candidatus Parabeggiatoa sp. nov. 1]|nr:MAG: hypothetical protein DRR19_08150 [Gammaproteobacteria bacterium]
MTIMWIWLGLVLLIVILLVVLINWRKVPLISLIIAGLIIGTYATLIVIGGLHDWRNESESERPEHVVMSFIQDMNPELNQKMQKIQEEIALADNKIQQLQALRKTFSNQSQMIDKKINRWQTLEGQLNQVSADIYDKVERAYVIYKIDEIEGRNKFSVLSKELLKEANAVLANAEATKSTIEEQLDE